MSVPGPKGGRGIFRGHGRAYLHHLVRVGEILGAMPLSWHNPQYYQDLMAEMRRVIAAGAFAEFAEQRARGGNSAP